MKRVIALAAITLSLTGLVAIGSASPASAKSQLCVRVDPYTQYICPTPSFGDDR